MLQGGMRTADVARAKNYNVRTTRQTADRPRSGRPRVTTTAQDWMATTTARVTPGMHNPSISAQTVHNRLRDRHHRQQCRLWAQTHRRWTRQDWQKVLFTDESRFCLTRGRFHFC
uniref:Transposase Tc1-like domain-containing protein n=1 Tax=Hucho hucho TaxID=62062 RepID=A0A4W5JXM8_9TELE